MAKERENYLLLSSKQMVGILLDHFIKNIERKKGVVDGGGENCTQTKRQNLSWKVFLMPVSPSA